MTRSPCLTCHNLPLDKSNSECLHCRDRLAYVRGIGDLISPFPPPSMRSNQIPAPQPKIKIKEPIMDQIPPLEKKRCRMCGVEKPLDAFSKNKDCKQGVEGTCKACKQKQAIRRYNQLAAAAVFGARTNDVKAENEPQPALNLTDDIQNDPLSITIVFRNYPDIMEQIFNLARTEFRTPEMQVLYMLARQLDLVTPPGRE